MSLLDNMLIGFKELEQQKADLDQSTLDEFIKLMESMGKDDMALKLKDRGLPKKIIMTPIDCQKWGYHLVPVFNILLTDSLEKGQMIFLWE